MPQTRFSPCFFYFKNVFILKLVKIADFSLAISALHRLVFMWTACKQNAEFSHSDLHAFVYACYITNCTKILGVQQTMKDCETFFNNPNLAHFVEWILAQQLFWVLCVDFDNFCHCVLCVFASYISQATCAKILGVETSKKECETLQNRQYLIRVEAWIFGTRAVLCTAKSILHLRPPCFACICMRVISNLMCNNIRRNTSINILWNFSWQPKFVSLDTLV